jgi:hypothetical protein
MPNLQNHKLIQVITEVGEVAGEVAGEVIMDGATVTMIRTGGLVSSKIMVKKE